eukprot:7208801-Ditylum_brightwellii.AAC.1
MGNDGVKEDGSESEAENGGEQPRLTNIFANFEGKVEKNSLGDYSVCNNHLTISSLRNPCRLQKR